MPATNSAPPIPNANLFAVEQTAELREHLRQPASGEHDTLTKLVDAVRDAALNPAALDSLAYAVLAKEHKEHIPTGMHLAALLCFPAGPDAGIPADNGMSVSQHTVQEPDPSARMSEASTHTARRGIDSTIERLNIANMQKLWKAHVSRHITENLPETLKKVDGSPQRIKWIDQEKWADQAKNEENRTPYAPPSLLKFAAAYLREHPHENPRDIFLPFHQLAQRAIAIPDNISMVFEKGVLPFPIFRDLVSTYVDALPPQWPESVYFDAACVIWNAATYWEHSLRAISSPLAQALLDGGAIKPDTLLDWVGLKARVQHLDPRLAKQATPSLPPSELSQPMAVLLAYWDTLDFNDRPLTNAAFLKNPEDLYSLANNLVAFKHIEFLSSIADSVDEHFLAGEMRRVAGEYGRLNAATPKSPVHDAANRAYFYDPRFRDQMTSAHSKQLDISRAHVLVHQLRSDERLDAWTMVSPPGSKAYAQPYFERRSANALFEAWAAQGIPVEQQAFMARFMMQGFDQTWAAKITQAHVQDPARLQAWFTHGHDADLSFRLDSTMKSAVQAWLADIYISPRLLAFLPAMIQSDMGVERIDHILNTERPYSAFLTLEVVFGPKADGLRQVWHGLVTPEQLYLRIIDGDELEAEAKEADEQRLRDISEPRRKAAQVRDELRRRLHAMETLRAEIADDTPHGRRCARFADAWRGAIAVLDGLLQPESDTRLAQQPQEFIDKLTTLHADLNFQITDLEEPAHIAGLNPLA
jgi:hypothetical protein